MVKLKLESYYNILLGHHRLHITLYCFLLIFNYLCMCPQRTEHGNYTVQKGQEEGRQEVRKE